MKYIVLNTLRVSVWLLLSFSSASWSAYETQLSSAVNWLATQQNADGSWGAEDNMKFLLTVEAVKALNVAGFRKNAYQKGLVWLENHSIRNFDYGSRLLSASISNGVVVDKWLEQLQNAQQTTISERHGWGISSDYLQSPLDTALILSGLNTTNTPTGTSIQTAIDYLKSSQLNGAGWPLSLGSTSDAFTTIWVIKALQAWQAQDATLSTFIDQGIALLISQIDISAPLYLQAMAAQASIESGHSSEAQNWLYQLSVSQLSDGSMQNDILSTISAIKAIAIYYGLREDNLHTRVNIPDAALRSAINSALGRNILDSLNRQELAQLRSLSAVNFGISDLTGLEWAVNLNELDLRDNQIADITPINKLGIPNLKLHGNPVAANTLAWSLETGSWNITSPAIGLDGTIYFTSYDRNMYAMNPDGSLKWMNDVPKTYATENPTVGLDGTVYIGDYSGMLHALNPTDGHIVWSKKVSLMNNGSPAIGVDGTLYVASGVSVYALDPNKNGEIKWTYNAGGGVSYSMPVIGEDGTVYIGSADNYLYALTPNLTLKWKFLTGAPINSIVGSVVGLGDEGRIYLNANDGNLYALDKYGNEIWRAPTGTTFAPASPVVDENGVIYAGSYNNKNLTAYDPIDGSVLWTFHVNSPVTGSAAIGDNGTIYFGSYDNFYAINPDGTEKWRHQTYRVDGSPIIDNQGIVYIGASSYRKFYAIYTESTGIAPSVWPVRGGNLQRTHSLGIDQDGDFIADGWEQDHGLDPSNPDDANWDWDGDNYTNYEEYMNGTDPEIYNAN